VPGIRHFIFKTKYYHFEPIDHSLIMHFNIIYASLSSQGFQLLNFLQVLHTRLRTLSQNLHLDSYLADFTHYKDNTITIYRPKGVYSFSLACIFIQQLPKVKTQFLTFYNNNESEIQGERKVDYLISKGNGVIV